MTRGWSIIQCSQMICDNQKNKFKNNNNKISFTSLLL